jgi:NhaA family Na+:H+ antiporter
MSQLEHRRGVAPEAWVPARRAVERVLRPLERFLRIEAAGGVVLLVAAVIALVWANSPWSRSYVELWHADVTLGVGSFTSARSLHFWINDGLMVVFFFVVGLEIRREIHEGELSDAKRAALPAAAALGGMIVPALIFFALNHGLPTQSGWGVPMATDIAFAVGALALLGSRVPAALRVLLLALAIIDDIGAIVVIAIFYSSGVSVGGLALAACGVLGVLFLQRIGVRRALVYVVPGFVIWLGCLEAGIHPTIAGVILGLLTPAKPWFGERGFLVAIRHAVEDFRGQTEREDHRTEDLIEPLDRVKVAHREAVAPAVRLQTILHPWVAFVIMPLFALANAGVALGGTSVREALTHRVLLGVVLGLVIGKPIGVVTASAIAIRARVAAMPAGVSWRGIALVGCVAGIGFTMAIFIADLAFADAPATLGTAKLAVLLASVISGVIAVVVGALVLGAADPRAARTPSEAEASAEL